LTLLAKSHRKILGDSSDIASGLREIIKVGRVSELSAWAGEGIKHMTEESHAKINYFWAVVFGEECPGFRGLTAIP